jgi:23S rRNA pseudouridine2605 synthase
MPTGSSRRSPARATVSLERALSKLGLASRADARRLIQAGRVAVDGVVADNPLIAVVPERVRVTVDGGHRAPSAALTIALHKPRGVVTTASDPEGRPTVYDLLEGLGTRVVPVGRLDLATSGLLLLTTDTRFADWLTDPRSNVPRVYLVTAHGRVREDDVARLKSGVMSRDQRLAASDVVLRKASSKESHLVVTLSEGRNREVRRLFLAIGHEVTRLRRVQVGGLELGDLPPRAWRVVEPKELRQAFPRYRPRRAAGTSPCVAGARRAR